MTGPPFPSEEDGAEGSGILSGGRRHDAATLRTLARGLGLVPIIDRTPPERGAANAEKLLGVPLFFVVNSVYRDNIPFVRFGDLGQFWDSHGIEGYGIFRKNKVRNKQEKSSLVQAI